jgi:arabinofuranan 3-O-arabinosyltransferase
VRRLRIEEGHPDEVFPACDVLVPLSSLLSTPAGTGATEGSARTVTTGAWGSESREVAVGSGPATVLVVHENTNPGWTATLHGTALQAVVVDGWQQGWVVPAGAAGTVHLRYGPGRTYVVGLLLGALGVLVLLGLALLPARPGRPSGAPELRRTGFVLAAGGLLVLGGLPGLGALVVAWLLRRWAGALVVAGITGTVVVGIAQRWPAGRGAQSAASQLLVLLALAAAASAATQRDERLLHEPVGDGGDGDAGGGGDEPDGAEGAVERPAGDSVDDEVQHDQVEREDAVADRPERVQRTARRHPRQR